MVSIGSVAYPSSRPSGEEASRKDGVPQTLQIACLVHVHSSSVAVAAELTQLLDDVCWPLLRIVDDGAAAPISLHLSGPILSHARAADPHFLVVLKQCIRDGRIELVGGALYDTAMPSIPARDALGQLLACGNLQEELFGVRPEGAWLPLSAWDPSVIAPLRDADITWTLVDAAAWEAVGWDPWDVHGHYTTERHGRAVSVFPIDDALSSAAHAQDAAGLGASLKRVAGRPQAPLLVSLVLDGEHLVRSCHHTELMSCLRSNQHWLKPRLFCGLRESLPSRGPVYLGQSAWPGLAPWCQPTSSSSSSFDDGEDAAVGPVVWENSLVRYPEANRLHKRMLRVSERVETLRKVLVRQQRKGKNISAAKQLMEKACAGLWRAQGHDVYWHGGRLHLGVYDSTLRSATLRDLLAAEKIVRRLLGGRAPPSWEEHLGLRRGRVG